MRGKILVIVQKATIRSMLESLLKEQSLEVVCFDNPQKSLDWLLLSKPDLIIIDYAVTDPTVLEVCQKIRQDQRMTNVPIIVLLTLEEMRESERLKQAGASNFLVKPFNPRELLEKVEIYLLEKEATSSQEHVSTGINHAPKPSDKLGELFAAEEGLDIDSILSEGKKAAESQNLEELLIPADDQITIEATPWGMDLTSEPEIQPKESEHDYSWFLGEMQREAKGEKSVSKPLSGTEPEPMPPSQPTKKSPERIEVEEMGTSKLDVQKIAAQIKTTEVVKKETSPEAEFNPQIVIEEENTFRKKDLPKPPPPKIETTKVMAGGETDYSRLYEDLTTKLAERLAKELASRLKPETIIQLLKEELEKVKG